MNPSQRPTTGATSWVQMSAAGSSPLAVSGGQMSRRPNPLSGQPNAMARQQNPLASSNQDPNELDLQQTQRLSFVSSSSTSSSMSSNSSSISQQQQQRQQQQPQQQYQFVSALQSQAGSRLASVLGAGGGNPQSLISSSSSTATSTGASGASTSNAAASQSGPHSFQSAAATSEGPSLPPMSFGAAASSQQLQAAMGELQLAEQQLLGFRHVDLNQADANQADDLEAQQRAEANRKLRLQLYVFVLRCISYPFNAKQQSTGGDHRQQQVKLRKGQLEQIVKAHERFIRSGSADLRECNANNVHLQRLGKVLADSQMSQLEELQLVAHRSFERRVIQNERLRLLVEAECCSQQDLRDLFRQNAERILKESQPFIAAGQKQQAQQNHMQPLSNREAILSAWLATFESSIRPETDGAEPAAGSNQPGGGPSRGLMPAGVGSAGSNVSLTGSEHSQGQQQMSKEQLYQMFQNILNIKKFEHQLLYNALQLDSSDEQAAAIRRELDGRVARIAELERNKKLLPKFVLKEMESLYLEETRMAVNRLMVNLDSLPVIKSLNHHHPVGDSRGLGPGGGVYSGLQKFRRYNSRAQATLTRDGLAECHPSEPQLSKLDVVLTFNIEVIVMEVRGLRNISSTREIYCTMEIEGSETGRLQTEHVPAKKPLWDTQGDFVTNHPLPVLKIKLYAVNPSMLSLEDKELGKLVLRPSVLSPKTPEWCTMLATNSDKSSSSLSSDKLLSSGTPSGGVNGGPGVGQDVGCRQLDEQQQSGDQLKIRVIVRMDRPQQLKHCGFLYGLGKSCWRKFRRRYHILIQVSQYTFVMCDFRDKKSKPTEMLQLDGYTVDYIEPPTDLIMEHCSEMTSSEHLHHGEKHHHGSGVSGTFSLAGRLAKPFLKQSHLIGVGGGGGGSSGSSQTNLDDGGQSMGGGQSAGYSQEHQEGQVSAIQTAAALSDELHNKFYFNVVKEGDSVVFACDDEQECLGWVMALYRATGQAHKPTPLREQYASSSYHHSSQHYIDTTFAYNAAASGREQTKLIGLNGSGSSSVASVAAGISSPTLSASADVAHQRARKHGMDEFIGADPCKFQHNQLFKFLQDETLRYRLNDQFLSLGWLSSGQLFVLDEYCARYGVRTCYRHLAYLNSLLDFNSRGFFIDHTLINYGYDFCSSFVSGQSGQLNPMSSVNFDLRPDGTVGTVTVEERDLFHGVKQKLLKMIERQLANFPYCFPYGKPDGALKSTLSLLERVLMKQESAVNQMNSMLQNDECRSLIRKCLEQAALNNYTRLSGQANLLQPVVRLEGGTLAGAAELSGQNQQVGDGQSLESNSGQSSPSCSPVPTQDQSEVGSFLSRRRTQSNLSGASSSNSSTSFSPNASLRRAQSQRPTTTTKNRPDQTNQQQCITMAMIINNEQVRPPEKLRYLIRLAELCCEQAEENNEFFADAFAWHSDLMTDHFELFWSLFSVDMDKILAELNTFANSQQQQQQSQQQQQQQSASTQPMPLGRTISASGSALVSAVMANAYGQQLAGSSTTGELLGVGTRDTFALFQVLNNHLRRSSNNFECRKFRTYLCDTFKPKLLRYIDVMESTLTRMVFKANEKEGQVNCRLIEQVFMRLDELQQFVLRQLRWPDEQLAEQLHQRLKLMAYELCDASVQRTQSAFQQLEKRSNKWTATTTSYSSPVEMIQMINLTLDTRNKSLKLCTFNGFDQMSYHSKIDKLVEGALGEMQPGLMAKMLNALDSTLNKLARFDEGNLLAPILNLTLKQGMSSSGRDIGKQYVSFVSNCCDLIRHKINDELWIVSLLEDWYAAQMNTICNWLAERIDRSLHDVQLVALTNIMPKIYADMSLQGVPEEKLNSKGYQTIMSRLKMEEASSLAGGNLFEQPSSSSIFNTSILSSLTSSSSSSSSAAANSAMAATSTSATTTTTTGQPGQGNQLRQQSSGGSLGSGQLQSQPPRRLGNLASMSGPSSEQAVDSEQGDNIADRALQSATRMFKGFWN